MVYWHIRYMCGDVVYSANNCNSTSKTKHTRFFHGSRHPLDITACDLEAGDGHPPPPSLHKHSWCAVLTFFCIDSDKRTTFTWCPFLFLARKFLAHYLQSKLCWIKSTYINWHSSNQNTPYRQKLYIFLTTYLYFCRMPATAFQNMPVLIYQAFYYSKWV